MSRVVKMTVPSDGTGKDPNDAHVNNDEDFRARVEAGIDDASRTKKPDMGWLDRFTLTDKETGELADPEWLYKNLIIRSHLIAIIAAPGAGKTTIMMQVAAELAKDYQVVYVNADVGGGDVKKMHAMSKESGFHLLLPDMKAGLSMDDVVQKLEDMNHIQADYSDTLFFFDTLKKMTDVINKSCAKELYKVLRGLTAKGMTIVLLGHTNKYDDVDGNPVYEGTGDLRSDVDDLIYLVPKDNPDGSLTVSTDPLSATAKRRGTHEPITFNISPDRQVTRHKEYIDVSAQTKACREREKDATAIEAVTAAIQAGDCKQMEIVDWCRKHHSIGRRSSEAVLHRYLNKLWKRQSGFQNNAWIYELCQ